MSKASIPDKIKKIIDEGQVVGKSGEARQVIGGSTINNLLAIQGIMNQIKPVYTMEIGMAYGVSTFLFALKHEELSGKPNNQHYSIDPFQISHWDSCGLMLLEREGMANYVNYFESFSSIQLPKWVEDGLKFDLIYIDGSHLFEDVFIDYYYCSPLLNANGMMLFDDCRDPHVLKVIKFIKSNMADFFEEIDLNEYVKREGRELIKYRVASKLNKIQLRGFVKRGNSDQRAWDARFLNF